jgi:hypothetical protein
VTERWTGETEKLAYGAVSMTADIELARDRAEVARAVLTALADAGLLLPPDVEAHRRYGRKMPNGLVLVSHLPDPTHYRLNGPWRPVDTEEAKP